MGRSRILWRRERLQKYGRWLVLMIVLLLLDCFVTPLFVLVVDVLVRMRWAGWRGVHGFAVK